MTQTRSDSPHQHIQHQNHGSVPNNILARSMCPGRTDRLSFSLFSKQKSQWFSGSGLLAGTVNTEKPDGRHRCTLDWNTLIVPVSPRLLNHLHSTPDITFYHPEPQLSVFERRRGVCSAPHCASSGRREHSTHTPQPDRGWMLVSVHFRATSRLAGSQNPKRLQEVRA